MIQISAKRLLRAASREDINLGPVAYVSREVLAIIEKREHK